MCFFEMTRYACGDWKWGNFKGHCNREYRIGETCGMKLVEQTLQATKKCTRCDKVETKLRRRQKIYDRIVRWEQEERCPASVEKSWDEIRGIDCEIKNLQEDIMRARGSIGNQGGSYSAKPYYG